MKHGTIARNYLFLFLLYQFCIFINIDRILLNEAWNNRKKFSLFFLLYQFCIFINIDRILLNEAWNNRKKFSLFVSLVPVLYIY